MKSEIMADAAEYNAATNRVSSALQLLRDEMKSLRHQDITLMRQLININDKIRSMSKEQVTAKNRAKRMRNRTLNVSATMNQTTPSWQTPLVRQQSVPRFCEVIPEVRERRGSTSSDDDCSDESLSGSVTSLEESDVSDSNGDVSSNIPVFNPPMLQRQRSRSMQVPEIKIKDSISSKDTKYELILNRNVKIWKDNQDTLQPSDTDSVFDDSEEEIAL